MKKIFFFLCFVFLATENGSAQITFQKTYGTSFNDQGHRVNQTSDGGYIISGIEYGLSSFTFLLIRINSAGDTLWTKNLDGAFSYTKCEVEQTSDGGFILVGSTFSSGISWDVCIIKTDSSGNILWSKTIGGNMNDFGVDIQQTNDGGFIITGVTYSYGAGAPDIYLIRTDINGDTLWTKTFGGIGSESGYSVRQTSDGGFIVAGSTESFGSGNLDFYLIKTNGSGNLIWSATYGGADNEYAYSARETMDGGYIIAGKTDGYGADSMDILLIKVNANGNILWSKTFGGTSYDYPNHIEETINGEYIICGVTDSFGAGSGDAYLIKTDSAGTLIWSKVYGGTGTEYGACVKQTADYGFIICATSTSFGIAEHDIYLIKTDSSGNSGCYENDVIPVMTTPAVQMTTPATLISSGGIVGSLLITISGGCNVATECTSVGIEDITRKNNITLFPNPSSSKINFSFLETGNHFLTIKNTMGETILIKSVTGKTFSIDVKDFPAGIYFVTMTDEKKNMVVKKFVKM